jgi:hypothetical protein
MRICWNHVGRSLGKESLVVQKKNIERRKEGKREREYVGVFESFKE